jgi:hypothetical protein
MGRAFSGGMMKMMMIVLHDCSTTSFQIKEVVRRNTNDIYASNKSSESTLKKGKKDDEYKLAHASIEGWFPPVFWAGLKQNCTSLGQLLQIDESRKVIL